MRRRITGFWAVTLLLLGIAPAFAQGISDPDIRAAAEAAPKSGWDQTWGVASHVLPVTHAVEASMLEAGPAGQLAQESILVIKTIPTPSLPDGIYLHDYRRCSSIHLTSLAAVADVSAGGGEFLLLETEKSNIREFAVYFIVHDLGTQWLVDSEYLADDYVTQGAPAVYNVQLWSSDPQETLDALGRFLTELGSQRPTSFLNTTTKVPPPVFANWVNLRGSEVTMRLRSPAGVSALDITTVAWTAPNPTPTIHVTNLASVGPSEIVSIDLSGTHPNPSDVEVQFHTGGAKADQVFTSFNAFGDGASNWLPFASGDGSTASLQPVEPPSTAPPMADAEARLNGSTVRLDAHLTTNSSFIGIFSEILPELATRPDFRDYEDLKLRLATSHAMSRSVELKLEFEAGATASQVVVPAGTWTEYSLPFSSFLMGGSPLDWSTWGNRLVRVTIAAVDVPGEPRDFSIDVSTLEFARTPLSACNDGLDNDGDGSVDAADTGCSGAEDRSEFNEAVECDDGADNDEDGLFDFPQDPDCTSTLDVVELPEPCVGLGVIAGGLFLGGLVRTRAQRR
ncbi:MAG: hypothetical protein ACQGVC_09225 [Myxococcota bacterium]